MNTRHQEAIGLINRQIWLLMRHVHENAGFLGENEKADYRRRVEELEKTKLKLVLGQQAQE